MLHDLLYEAISVHILSLFLTAQNILGHVGPYFPDLGLNLCFPLQWKCRVLTTGPPGKSLTIFWEHHLLILVSAKDYIGLPGGSVVKNPSAMRETPVWSQGQEDPPEKEMTTHSSILAWENPWTEEHARLQSTALQKSQTWFSNETTFYKGWNWGLQRLNKLPISHG